MTKQEATADRLFSRFIRERDGVCQLAGDHPWPCWGRLECAHLIGRSYRAVRYEPRNAAAFCSLHHQWLDQHPIAKTAWATEYLGGDVFAVLWEKAQIGRRPDLPLIIANLRDELVR